MIRVIYTHSASACKAALYFVQRYKGLESGKELFNGNISYSTYAIGKFESGATAGYSYRYDQLNRLTAMSRHTVSSSNSSWSNSSIIDAYKEQQITYDANGNIKTYKRNGDKAGSLAPMDDLKYGYTVDNNGRLVNNKLRHVKDAVDNSYSTDIDNQANDNYTYDKIGNLIADDAAFIQKINWTVYGKMATIQESNKNITYDYDAGGNRINKKVADNNGSTATHYVRDAQGNVMSVYSYKGNTAGTLTQGAWNEQHLYGSNRIGMLTPNLVITTPLASANYNGTNDHTEDEGKRLYELSNHLGNVMVTISDKKIGIPSPTNSSLIDHYEADVVSAYDYYPFGMQMPGRTFNAAGSYRYGFNGKEKDDEVKNKEGSQIDYGERIYDTRASRFLSVDPKASLLQSYSPYAFCLDNPINLMDPDGQFPILVNGRVGKNSERANSSYWDIRVRETIKAQTGYYHSQFKYVDGDKGFWPSTRVKAGVAQGKTDAAAVYAKLKETMKDGQITEQLQVISHSRGGAFANSYMQGLTAEVVKLAEKDKIGFAYGKENIVEYSVNLAPHQSNWINYESGKNVNVSHIGDPLSGNDATGNVINVQSIPEKDASDQHGNKTYNTELNFILNTLENNTDKSKLFEQIKAGYEKYDKGRTNRDKSKVTQGSN